MKRFKILLASHVLVHICTGSHGPNYVVPQVDYSLRTSRYPQVNGETMQHYSYQNQTAGQVSHISHTLPGRSSMSITRSYGRPSLSHTNHGQTSFFDSNRIPNLSDIHYNMPSMSTGQYNKPNFSSYTMPSQFSMSYNMPKQSGVSYNIPSQSGRSNNMASQSENIYNIPSQSSMSYNMQSQSSIRPNIPSQSGSIYKMQSQSGSSYNKPSQSGSIHKMQSQSESSYNKPSQSGNSYNQPLYRSHVSASGSSHPVSMGKSNMFTMFGSSGNMPNMHGSSNRNPSIDSMPKQSKATQLYPMTTERNNVPDTSPGERYNNYDYQSLSRDQVDSHVFSVRPHNSIDSIETDHSIGQPDDSFYNSETNPVISTGMITHPVITSNMITHPNKIDTSHRSHTVKEEMVDFQSPMLRGHQSGPRSGGTPGPFAPRFQVPKWEISDSEWEEEIKEGFQNSGLVPGKPN